MEFCWFHAPCINSLTYLLSVHSCPLHAVPSLVCEGHGGMVLKTMWNVKSTLSTAQPAYLHNLISVQPPGCTRSSSLITIARTPSSSSLKITDRSFRYASPSLWNNLPASFHQPCSSSVITITPSITSSLFHSRLKTHLFHKSFPP